MALTFQNEEISEQKAAAKDHKKGIMEGSQNLRTELDYEIFVKGKQSKLAEKYTKLERFTSQKKAYNFTKRLKS